MSLKDCIEHLYSWDYTIPDALGCPGCAERERIIKLIPDYMKTVLSWGHETAAKQLIALIKGEQE